MADLKADPNGCEEASTLSHNFYIPCNRWAEVLIAFPSGEGPYRMCKTCAAHSTSNRGAHVVGAFMPGAPIGKRRA